MQKQISLLQLSERSNIPLRTLEDWDTYKRIPRKVENINLIAEILCVSIQNFYTEEIVLKDKTELLKGNYFYYCKETLFKRQNSCQKEENKAIKPIKNSFNVFDLDKITKRRRELGLTQKKLAGLSGISVQTIQNWYFAKTTPAFHIMNKIANVLNCPIEFFFCDELLNTYQLTSPFTDYFTLDDWELIEITLNILVQQCVSDECKKEIHTLLTKIKSYIIKH